MAGLEGLRLADDSRLVRSAFRKWHEVLEAGSIPVGTSRELESTDVRFRRIARHKTRLHISFWVGSSEDAAVQLNEPSTPGSENPGSSIAVDTRERRYLVRQGDLHENNRSNRIKNGEFTARTGLSPIPIEVESGPAKKHWYVVAQLDGVSPARIRTATVDFVRRCWNARTYGAQAADDQKRLHALFGKPERGGWYEYQLDSTVKRLLKLQGYVFEQLEEVLGREGIEIHKPRHAAGYEVDGAVKTPKGPALLEIKTGTSAADVYCGVGQLNLYPVIFPDLGDHAKLLLLPGDPSDELICALEDCGIELHSYELKRDGRKAMVRFSRKFLRRCGISG